MIFLKLVVFTICLGKNVDKKPSKLLLAAKTKEVKKPSKLVLAVKTKEVKKVCPVGMFEGEPGTTLVTFTFSDEPRMGRAVAKVPQPGIMICRFVDL